MRIDPSELLVAPDTASRLRTPERVASVLSDRIRSGAYGVGDPLPTERELAADLHVHRRSVREAIDFLVRDGFVTRRPNCRPTVGRTFKSTESRDHNAPARISASNLVALIMWHGGGPLEHAGTSQQRIFWGMNQILMKVGYHAVFLDLGQQIGSEEENAAQEATHLRYIADQGFGGALFYPYAYRHNAELVSEVSRIVPLVLLDRRIAGVVTDFVGISNHDAIVQVTRALIAQGHRRIAYVTRFEPIMSVQDRVEGYLDAMRSAPEADLSEMILEIPAYPPTDDRAWTVVDAVFRQPKEKRPTAAVCFADYMAVELAARLEYLGLTIPVDAAVTGFDNIIPTLPNGKGLTTLAQPYEDIGTVAVELLLRRIKDAQLPPTSIELPTRLIVRASSSLAAEEQNGVDTTDASQPIQFNCKLRS